MIKKMKGFTLIELLIVVAIIGILAALLIPNAMAAIQKAKQKGTMKDINTIATALMDYVTDKGVAPAGGIGPLATGDAISVALTDFYIKALPIYDQWAHPFDVFTRNEGCSTNGYGITLTSGEYSDDDFIVASTGRDGAAGDMPYRIEDVNAGFYTVNGMIDFDKELVTWNGSWVVGPRAVAS